MTVVEERLKKIGCPKTNLHIRSTNKNVIKFYVRIRDFNEHLTAWERDFLKIRQIKYEYLSIIFTQIKVFLLLLLEDYIYESIKFGT